MTKKKGAAQEFAKLGKEIKKMAKTEGAIAFTNRLKLFVHGKPGRRWWFVDKEKEVLISAEHGLTDREALEALKRGLKKK